MKKAGIIFFIGIILLTGILKINYLLQPVNKNDNSKYLIKINRGSSSKEIAEKLKSKELITSKWMFTFIVNFYGLDNQLQAGLYRITPANTLKDIISKIVEGNIATFQITIPEGYTIEEVAEKLEKLTLYKKGDFLEIAKDSQLISSWVDLSKNNSINYELEGFIYPDTYVIPVEYSAEEILEVMINEFRNKWENILKDQTRFSLYEYLTIASLIEKEARLDEEKPIISGVIYNRINQDMALQIDASVQYILEEWKKRLLYKDLEEDSPYNTYLFKGLPPGPICNPGDEAIQAALEPAEVEYLFYFALDNGSHIFTKTYQEHLNKQKEIKQKK